MKRRNKGSQDAILGFILYTNIPGHDRSVLRCYASNPCRSKGSKRLTMSCVMLQKDVRFRNVWLLVTVTIFKADTNEKLVTNESFVVTSSTFSFQNLFDAISRSLEGMVITKCSISHPTATSESVGMSPSFNVLTALMSFSSFTKVVFLASIAAADVQGSDLRVAGKLRKLEKFILEAQQETTQDDQIGRAHV